MAREAPVPPPIGVGLAQCTGYAATLSPETGGPVPGHVRRIPYGRPASAAGRRGPQRAGVAAALATLPRHPGPCGGRRQRREVSGRLSSPVTRPEAPPAAERPASYVAAKVERRPRSS